MHYQTILALVVSFILTISCVAQTNRLAASFGSIDKIAALENARAAHTATRLVDGNVLIVGGMQRDGVLDDTVELFDAGRNRFIKLANRTNKKIFSHTATLLPDGRVLIAGGWSNRSKPEDTAEIYNPQTQTFSTVGAMKSRRSGHSATLLANGKVLIAGGSDGDANLNSAELFDPATNSFEFAAAMHRARNVHTATTLADGKILLSGGETRRGEVVADAELYNPSTNRFIKIHAPMNAARYKHDSVLLADGNVLIFGGSDYRDFFGRLKSAEIYNVAKQTFTATGEMNRARFKINETAILLSNGKVLIAGGGESAEIFDPQTKAFSPVAGSFGKSFHYATVTLLKDERVLILGGYEFVRSGAPTGTNQAWIFKV